METVLPPIPERLQSLKYLDNLREKQEAVLDEAVALLLGGTHYIISTHDPVWSITNQGGQHDWLHYRGQDGGDWLTKIHAEIKDGEFHFWFESKHPGASNGNNGSFIILDWDNKPQKIELQAPDPWSGTTLDVPRKIHFLLTPH